MSIATLLLFNTVPSEVELQPYFISEYGVFVTERAAYAIQDIRKYLEQTGFGDKERNSHFWSSWQYIRSSDDVQLLVDQIFHYVTTYGLESLGVDSKGYVYIPEKAFVNHSEVQIRVIDATPKEEIIERCFNLLNSGLALAEDTIRNVIEALQECGYTITGNEHIRNREAQILFYQYSAVLPQREDELFRYLIYWFTGKTLIVNDKDTREKIGYSRKRLPDLGEKHLRLLAESFNRHKDLWMAIKSAHTENRATVNRISRLSKIYHTPMVQNPLNLVTMYKFSGFDLAASFHGATMAQLVRAYNSIALRKTLPNGSVYQIRNGKRWVSSDSPIYFDFGNEKHILSEIRNRVGDQLFYVEQSVNYAFPTSEKNFVGNIPSGTILKFPKDGRALLIGVHWDDYNTDLDLRADSAGFSLGWNTGFRNSKHLLMHSGDMTRAPAPYGATEWIYAKDLDEACIIKVNNYNNGNVKAFKLMIGVSKNTPDRNSQIPPKDLVASFEVPMTSRQSDLGFLYADKDYLYFQIGVSGTGKGRVGRYSNYDKIQQEVNLLKTSSALRFWDVASITNKLRKGVKDLSISNLTKDSFLF